MRFFAFLCLFFLSITGLQSASIALEPVEFDVKSANLTFDKINLKLSTQNLELNNLNAAIETLTSLTRDAEQCIEDAQKKLTALELLLKQDNNTPNDATQADHRYLNNEKKEHLNTLAQCRLFSIRANEAINAYKSVSIDLKQEMTLTRGDPLWSLIQPLKTEPQQLINILPNVTLFYSLYNPVNLLLLAGSSLILSVVSLYLLRNARFSKKYFRFKRIKFSYLFTLSFATFFILLLISQCAINANLTAPLSKSIAILTCYFLTWFLLIFIFKVKPIRRFFYWYSLDYHTFRSFLFFLLTSYTVIKLGSILQAALSPPQFIARLTQSIFILVFLSIALYFALSFSKKHKQHRFIKRYFLLINGISILFFLSDSCLAILGYYRLSLQMTYAAFLSLTVLFFTVLITQAIQKSYFFLKQDTHINQRISSYFGYNNEDTFIEFFILKTTLQLVIILTGLFLIAESIGFSSDITQYAFDEFIHGVHFANTTFFPTRMIGGLVIFCIIYLLARALSTHLRRKGNIGKDDEEETQVVIASILTYIGFGIAVISGLLIAGFNFTGLAIVAGALSVGIGLGLQSIVSNFVSGLILLIEKPLKPGDRISVDGVEGFVKKIQVRSTQIVTTSREDIIIPNSDLITRRVTNFMYSDKFCRIQCEIGVAYGSDTHLVRDTLIEIATNHDEVIKTAKNKPVVLFQAFGESNLIFDLSCLIKDVNKKSLVKSELNFEIDRLFRERNIQMAFPQHEIFLKNFNTLNPPA